jgi:hypothetical protein
MSEAVAAPAAPEVPAAAPSAPAAPAEGGAPAQNPAATAPAAPTDAKPATGENPDTTQPPQQGKHRVERKINRLYREAAEQKARADFLEKQLSETRQKAAPAEDPGAPRLEAFSDIQEYAKAYAKYESERALKEHAAKQQNETHQQQQARLVEGWEAKTEKAETKYPDFDEVVGDLKPTSAWAIAVMEAENADDVAYYLGTHLDEARKIVAMTPLAQARAIGKIEAKLLAEPPKPKTASKAPAPITPLSGAAQVATDVPSDEDDLATWMKKRNKQVHGARR